MTVNEVRAILRVSKSQFYRLKELPRFKIGGEWRVRPSDLQKYLLGKEAIWTVWGE